MDSALKDLWTRAQALPAVCGVYLMKDGKGRVLYIGKAKSMRDRVKHHFSAQADARTRLWAGRVAEFEILETPSEVDALLLEARLIKEFFPKYNRLAKDGKTFPCLQVVVDEPFPRVEVTRDPRPGAALYGPFVDAGSLKRAAQILQGVFRFRTCDLEIRPQDPKRRFQRPCLLHWIRRCTAPCADRISQKRYAQDIASLRMFLEGERGPLLEKLSGRMSRAAARMDYEAAAALRDQVRALETLAEAGSLSDRPDLMPLPLRPKEALEEVQRELDLAAPPRVVEGIDIATLLGEDSVGSVVTFVDGIPFKGGYRRFRVRQVPGVDDYAMIQEVARRRYRRLVVQDDPLPDLILVDGGKGQLAAARSALSGMGIRTPIASLAKREEEVYLPGRSQPLRLDRHSVALRFLQYVRDEAHRFAQVYHHLLRKKRMRPKRSHKP